jgi:hypothetical protein
MDQTKPIDTKALIEEAKNSKDKEAYKLLDKTQSYRIGVGARVNSPNPPSFFIEGIIKLSTENSKVNLPRLKRTLISLQALQNEGYTLTYQDDNTISAEKTIQIHEILQEHATAKSIINNDRKTYA